MVIPRNLNLTNITWKSQERPMNVGFRLNIYWQEIEKFHIMIFNDISWAYMFCEKKFMCMAKKKKSCKKSW